MDEVGRLLISLALAGAALTLAGGGVIWSMDEARRVRRSLAQVLGEPPHAQLTARGKGLGFNFTTNQLAVTWNAGAWCLTYRQDELIGAELILDGQVAARVYRGETRRALDSMAGAQTGVRFRLVFDDVRHPDFLMDLWLPEDETRRKAMTAPEAVQEANRWLARIEAMLRRPAPRRADPLVAAPTPPPPTPRPDPEPGPPWELDPDDEPEAMP